MESDGLAFGNVYRKTVRASFSTKKEDCTLCVLFAEGKQRMTMTYIDSGVSFSSEFLEVVDIMKSMRKRLQRVGLSKDQNFTVSNGSFI